MPDAEEFYRQRDRRSTEYLGRAVGDLVPLYVEIDAASCTSAAGQLGLLALANQLARISRRITFCISAPSAKVLARTPFNRDTLAETVLHTVRGIDPYGEFSLGSRPPADCVAIGLGDGVARDLHIYIGAREAIAYVALSPQSFRDSAGTLRGAALASCLGAAAVLRVQLGEQVTPRALSAWNYEEGDAADCGPETLDAVNVGRVLMVGAGAVGSALAYWLYAFGVAGEGWVIVDGDTVELHNTNRSLPFLPSHSGWPSGKAVGKAEVLAPLLDGAAHYPVWYHDCTEIKEREFDVVLALANDHEVRARLTSRYAAIALQATTGENWLSQLHRHILRRDDCIFCRTGEVKAGRFECAQGEVVAADGTKSDAALPFLSASSGLMLATALQRLTVGALATGGPNCWSWDFASGFRMTSRPATRVCTSSCSSRPSARAAQKLVAGTRWAMLVA